MWPKLWDDKVRRILSLRLRSRCIISVDLELGMVDNTVSVCEGGVPPSLQTASRVVPHHGMAIARPLRSNGEWSGAISFMFLWLAHEPSLLGLPYITCDITITT